MPISSTAPVIKLDLAKEKQVKKVYFFICVVLTVLFFILFLTSILPYPTSTTMFGLWIYGVDNSNNKPTVTISIIGEIFIVIYINVVASFFISLKVLKNPVFINSKKIFYFIFSIFSIFFAISCLSALWTFVALQIPALHGVVNVQGQWVFIFLSAVSNSMYAPNVVGWIYIPWSILFFVLFIVKLKKFYKSPTFDKPTDINTDVLNKINNGLSNSQNHFSSQQNDYQQEPQNTDYSTLSKTNNFTENDEELPDDENEEDTEESESSQNDLNDYVEDSQPAQNKQRNQRNKYFYSSEAENDEYSPTVVNNRFNIDEK